MGDICLYGMEVSFMMRLTVLVTFDTWEIFVCMGWGGILYD